LGCGVDGIDLQISGSLAVLLEAIFLGCKFR